MELFFETCFTKTFAHILTSSLYMVGKLTTLIDIVNYHCVTWHLGSYSAGFVVLDSVRPISVFDNNTVAGQLFRSA